MRVLRACRGGTIIVSSAVHFPSTDSDSHRSAKLAEVERALVAGGLEPRFSHADDGSGPARSEAELTIAAAEESRCRRLLAGCGFGPVPAGRGDVHLCAFDRDRGGWIGLRLRIEGRFPIPRARAWRTRGLGVAIMGPDGAGKSTLIANLERSFPLPVRSIYMGLYQGEESRKQSRFTVPGVALLSNLARQQLRWLQGLRHRLRGALVVFDRYTYDSLLPTGRPISRLGRLRRGLLGHACPGPDLVAVLDAPAEVLFARKGEHDLELLDLHRRGLLELAGRLSNAVVIDAGQDSEAVASDVVAAIWARHCRRAA